jgi:hypothetical protein
MEVYDGAHQTDEEHNTSLNVVNRICDPIKNKWYTVYMDRFFSSPKIFDHLWTANTKAVGTVMPNRKEMPKELFPEKQKKGENRTTERDYLLAIKWRYVRDVYLLSIAHDDRMVETPASRGAHQKQNHVQS